MHKKKIIMLFIIVLVAIVCLHIIDQYFAITYVSKTIIKIILFILMPFIYIFWSKDNFLSEVLKKPVFTYRKTTITLSIMVFIGIIIIFFVLKNQLNISIIIKELEEKYQVTISNLIFYGSYIIFINSFIEEFFFRGFIFLNLKKLNNKMLAYSISSFSFAIYHIAIFINWFSISVFILAFIVLIIGGLIFNYLDDKPNSFINSWILHMSADLAIVIIGFYLLMTN